ncbi:MAG: DUF5668 domain-containing protein [Thermoanaerobaculia bacterium]
MSEINGNPQPRMVGPELNAAPPPPPPIAYIAQPQAAAMAPQAKSPVLAGVLSALPGMGHVYLGLYQRAAIFFGVWVVVLSIANRVGGPLGMLVPFWWFFVLIDAVRQAKAINATGAPESNLVAHETAIRASGSLAFGVFLILFGGWFLLEKFVDIDLTFLLSWWPLVIVLFGAWQVFSHYKAKQLAETGSSPEGSSAL